MGMYCDYIMLLEDHLSISWMTGCS
jgi:hypothetical protein